MKPFRGLRSFSFMLVISSMPMLLGASCGGGQGDANEGRDEESTGPSGPRVESLESVDVGELSRSERQVWVELINDRLSPCGEPISVGRCVSGGADSEASGCRRCVPAARYLVRLIQDGYERQEIEELYDLRYGRDAGFEIDIEGAPERGSPMASVTIVEFSDFECPYCGRAHPIVQQVLREFEGRVRVIFRNYPLSAHPHALPAARAAVAAGNQDHFWEMHDLLFEHQRQLEEEDLLGYAEQLGLDMDRFGEDLASPETQARVEADREMGRELGIEGTPSFFINGRRFREPPSALAAYIREELDQ
ncbi:MAG: DsbA family protein [Sandaracinaceae bacterium]